jgi:general secretion pathway protein D
MEVATNKLDELGLNWPTTVQYGLPGAIGQIELGNRANFTASIANPALLATLRGDSGSTNLLANPSIRARNREKAKVQIGEKLPVFSTTSATVNVGASTAITYLDVGLKLEVEPTVQLDGDVTIKVSLDVSNLLREVSGPGGSLAYRVGTRSSSTTLRLTDGETQVLAGLINDEDRQSAVGLPGLSTAPVVGKLFGRQSDTRNKTEVVMLITPRILRQVTPLPAAAATTPSGTDSQPGAPSLRMAAGARAGLAASRGAASATSAQGADQAAGQAAAAAAAQAAATLVLAASGQARVGETVSVTLQNNSGFGVSGTLQFDAQALQDATAASAANAAPGQLPFTVPARGQLVRVLRVLPGAAGQRVALQVGGLQASGDGAGGADIRLEGEAVFDVPAVPAEAPK